jgi:Centromere DNA-binding protein complex CBF3 subunit, domain 2/Transcriptional activator of glycolytic enzymes
MSYSTHRTLCNDAFRKAKCHYLKGTHCGRHEGCKLADMQDIPDAQIRRLGRWDHSRMIQHYSLGIPRTGARHLAGHGSMEGISTSIMLILKNIIGNYYLDRECLIPPEQLQRQIFPRLEETEAMNNAKSERDQDIAVRCFMNLLRWLRVVLLQDTVFLRRKFPTLKIWLEPVFNNSTFEMFARELLHESEHGETPQYMRISRAMPDLVHQLHEQHGNMMNTMSSYHQSVLAENKQEHASTNDNNQQEHAITRNIIHQNMQPILSILADLSNSGVNFYTQTSSETRVQLANSSHMANVMTNVGPVTSINSSILQPVITEGAVMAAMTTMIAPTAMTMSTMPTMMTAPTAIAPPMTTAPPVMNSNSVEQYRLAAHVSTVVDLWKEYSVGIPHRVGTPAGPSIQQLDRDFGAKWRTNDNCHKAYS